jgi:hypothetical protein
MLHPRSNQLKVICSASQPQEVQAYSVREAVDRRRPRQVASGLTVAYLPLHHPLELQHLDNQARVLPSLETKKTPEHKATFSLEVVV